MSLMASTKKEVVSEARVTWTVEKRGSATRKSKIVPATKVEALLKKIDEQDGYSVDVCYSAEPSS